MLRWVPPAWRGWLKQTRLPGLRQFVKAVRLGLHLRRLGHVLNVEEILHERAMLGQVRLLLEHRCAALEHRSAAVEHRCAALEHRAAAVEKRALSLEEARYILTQQCKHLGDQTDLLKSSREVPLEWFEEFRDWKRENPLPETPRVSVCVATWNRAELLTQRCLPSLLRQTYKHLEIVVVGDGCTDDTAERIAELDDPRIRFVNLPQRGRYPEEPDRRWRVAGTVPMNHALSLCTGDFITHLDDDDEHAPERVEKLVAFACENDLDFVWHPFWYQNASGQWEFYSCDELRVGQVTTSSIFYRRWLTRIGWDINAHLLVEPGDWNRLRKFLYLGIKAGRFPEAFLRHYKEQAQQAAA